MLRAARDDDLPALLELWVASWSEVYPQIDFAARRTWFAGHLAQLEDAGAEVTVACGEDGATLGFVVFDPATGLMDQLCVAVAQKGKGVARALLDGVKRRAPERVHLTVNKANARAIAFYLREGFEVAGEAVNPNSGLPIWKMVWRLGPVSPRRSEPSH
jgi:putative acetyltransferase